MKARRNQILATVIACAMAVTATAPASAQSGGQIGGITHSDEVWIGVAIAAIGAGIGIGIYYAVNHNHHLTGCAISGPNGLELRNKGDLQTYALVGAVTSIKQGSAFAYPENG